MLKGFPLNNAVLGRTGVLKCIIMFKGNKVEKIIVGHQPQYFPYIGILNKISKADVCIITDNLQFNKKAFHNRTFIKRNDSKVLITIPVLTKNNRWRPINEMKINYEEPWLRKHLKTIFLAYSKCAYFNKYFDIIKEIYEKEHIYLSDLTSELLIFILREFEIIEDIRFSSELKIKGEKTEFLINLTKSVNGTKYLSGSGAKAYFDPEVFLQSELEHEFNEFVHPVYSQLGKNFIEGIGCIDLLMNCGKDGRKYIL